MEREVAKFIRGVMSRATVPADDQTQANLAAAKGWLDAIATGALVVRPAPKPRKAKAPQ